MLLCCSGKEGRGRGGGAAAASGASQTGPGRWVRCSLLVVPYETSAISIYLAVSPPPEFDAAFQVFSDTKGLMAKTNSVLIPFLKYS